MNWDGYSIVEATQLLGDEGIADRAACLTQLTAASYLIVSNERLNEFVLSDLECVDASEVDLTTQTNHLSGDLLAATSHSTLKKLIWTNHL